MEVVRYLPLEQRVPDTQFQDLLKRLKSEQGRDSWWEGSPQDDRTLKMVGHQMRFKFRNGFPLLTERDLTAPIERVGKWTWPSIFDQAVSELVAFMNGARTLDQLNGFGCYWWWRWLTQEKCEKRGLVKGDNGPGSYGAAWTEFPIHEGTRHNQIVEVFAQIKARPELRTHLISPWITPYVLRGSGQKVVVAPCHGWLHLIVNTEKKQLTVHHFQRSADILVGLVANIAQYAAFTLAAAQVLGLEAYELVYTLSEPHIYEMQLTAMEEILSRPPRVFPTVTLNTQLKDVRHLRSRYLDVQDYNPHPAMSIPTPV